MERRLITEELGFFSQASAVETAHGGGGSCSPSTPAASFTSEESSDA
jgi:hypothetical protein